MSENKKEGYKAKTITEKTTVLEVYKTPKGTFSICTDDAVSVEKYVTKRMLDLQGKKIKCFLIAEAPSVLSPMEKALAEEAEAKALAEEAEAKALAEEAEAKALAEED